MEPTPPPIDYFAAAYLEHIQAQTRKVRAESPVEPAAPLPDDRELALALLRSDEAEAAKPYRAGVQQLLRQLKQSPDILGEIQQVRQQKLGWWARVRLTLGWD